MNKTILTTILAIILTLAGHTYAGGYKMTAEDLTIGLIVKHEGFRPTVYTCPGGEPTIGWGFTDDDLIKAGTITREKADTILRARVRDEIAWVKTTFPCLKTEKQIAAIADLAFNVGHDKLCWKKVNGKRVHTNAYNYLKAGNINKAIPEILEFRLAGGKVMKGLVKRRAEEKQYLLA